MILKSVWYLAPVLLAPICSASQSRGSSADTTSAIAAAISDPRRPLEQTRLDAQRKPASLLAFAQIKPGDRVVDFMPGNAYFTRLFSDVVGNKGHVYAYIPTEQIEHCSPSEIAGTRDVAHNSSYANVTLLTGGVMNFAVPQTVDVVWTAQNYHDLHDSFMGPVNFAALNAVFFRALKPGGELVVIDHAAEPGSGLRDTETLHRIDADAIQSEVEAAGFVLEARSNVLRNPEDDHRHGVFDPLVRGITDQVVLLFRKPGRI